MLHKSLSHQPVGLYLYPPLIARQRLSKNVTAATNTHIIRIIIGRIIFYVICVVSRKVGY
jgi:hypothetical protein